MYRVPQLLQSHSFACLLMFYFGILFVCVRDTLTTHVMLTSNSLCNNNVEKVSFPPCVITWAESLKWVIIRSVSGHLSGWLSWLIIDTGRLITLVVAPFPKQNVLDYSGEKTGGWEWACSVGASLSLGSWSCKCYFKILPWHLSNNKEYKLKHAFFPVGSRGVTVYWILSECILLTQTCPYLRPPMPRTHGKAQLPLSQA